MRWGCLVWVFVVTLAMIVVVTLAVAGDRICGTNEEGIQAEYRPPFTCETNEGAGVG